MYPMFNKIGITVVNCNTCECYTVIQWKHFNKNKEHTWRNKFNNCIYFVIPVRSPKTSQ